MILITEQPIMTIVNTVRQHLPAGRVDALASEAMPEAPDVEHREFAHARLDRHHIIWGDFN